MSLQTKWREEWSCLQPDSHNFAAPVISSRLFGLLLVKRSGRPTDMSLIVSFLVYMEFIENLFFEIYICTQLEPIIDRIFVAL